MADGEDSTSMPHSILQLEIVRVKQILILILRPLPMDAIAVNDILEMANFRGPKSKGCSSRNIEVDYRDRISATRPTYRVKINPIGCKHEKSPVQT